MRLASETRIITLATYCDVRFTPSGFAVCRIYATDIDVHYMVWRNDPEEFGILPKLTPSTKLKVYGKEKEVSFKGREREVKIRQFDVSRWEILLGK